MTRDPRVAHEIVHARRVRPSRGPHAPHIAGGHPVDDSSASGTTSWPSWPTRSPCRSASGPTPPTLAGPVWPAGGSGSAATQPPAVPAPQVGWWATPCSGRPSSWPRRTRGSGFHVRGASEPSSPRRSECRTREARRGFHAPPQPETALATCVPAALPAGYPPTAPHLPQHGLIWRPGAAPGKPARGRRRRRVRPMACAELARPRRDTQREGVVQPFSGPPRGAPAAVVARLRRTSNAAIRAVFWW